MKNTISKRIERFLNNINLNQNYLPMSKSITPQSFSNFSKKQKKISLPNEKFANRKINLNSDLFSCEIREPSQQAIKNIMDFAKSYVVMKLKFSKHVEFIIN